MQVTNIADRLPRHATKRYPTRDLARLQAHVVHHTAGPPHQTPEAVAQYHINSRNWPGIGYTFWITATGEILQVNEPDTMCWGVRWHNDIYIGTGLPGKFVSYQQKDAEGRLVWNPDGSPAMVVPVPTPPQQQALIWLHNTHIPRVLSRHLPILGHKECLDASTKCPGHTWNWHAIEQEQPLYVIRVYSDRVEVE